MSDALYGLMGALGGSVVTAVAAYWGPLHQQREAAKQACWEAEFQRAEDRRLAEMQVEAAREETQAAREEAQAAREEVAKQEQIGRLAEIRTALREWQEVLDRTVQEMWNGAPVNLERFDAAEDSARIRASRAIDDVMRDEWFIPQSKYDRHDGTGRYRTSANGQVMAAMRDYRDLIRESVLSNSQASPALLRDLMWSQAEATEMRGMMSQVIEARMREVHTGEDQGRVISREW
ncbi:hypothetical protein ABZS86_36520 [Streptomyces sp. NPDC005355]|uniref:hypothetical protein n=1 Tax=Streptomyces sp. NPDC005355 TaxID=3157038 RepID=UPI00339F4AC9